METTQTGHLRASTNHTGTQDRGVYPYNVPWIHTSTSMHSSYRTKELPFDARDIASNGLGKDLLGGKPINDVRLRR